MSLHCVVRLGAAISSGASGAAEPGITDDSILIGQSADSGYCHSVKGDDGGAPGTSGSEQERGSTDEGDPRVAGISTRKAYGVIPKRSAERQVFSCFFIVARRPPGGRLFDGFKVHPAIAGAILHERSIATFSWLKIGRRARSSRQRSA
jgi:hypothetical protein